MAVKILSVDDSKTIRMIVAKAFKPFDCEMFEASNGVEGLAVAAREIPNLIILDITMPVMDGVECLSKLKSEPALKAIPVMMLTAESGRENVLKIAKLGIRDYLVKPFKENQLIEKAGKIVSLQVKSSAKAKDRTINDAVSLLVVDDKPAIIQQITDGVVDMPQWKVAGRGTATEAIEDITKNVPDAILVSLSLPEDGGFNLFQQFRTNPVTRSIPILGMCIKTDQEHQSRAEQMGFNGVLTKPLDLEALKVKLIRTMNLDTSVRYFGVDGDVQLLLLPAKVNSYVTQDLERYIGPKIQDMVNAGLNKLLMDLSKVTELDVSLVKIIISTITSCQELSINVRLVGSNDLKNELKAFQETSALTIDSSLEEAKAFLRAPQQSA